MAATTLWRLAQEQSGATLSAEEFRRWRKRQTHTLDTAAKALEVNRRMVAHYDKGEKPIARTPALMTKALEMGQVETKSIDSAAHSVGGGFIQCLCRIYFMIVQFHPSFGFPIRPFKRSLKSLYSEYDSPTTVLSPFRKTKFLSTLDNFLITSSFAPGVPRLSAIMAAANFPSKFVISFLLCLISCSIEPYNLRKKKLTNSIIIAMDALGAYIARKS